MVKVLALVCGLVLSLVSNGATNEVCKVCKGKKVVEQWLACEKCGGSGTEYVGSRQMRCSKCGNSIKKGKLRTKVNCPQCNKKEPTGPSYMPRGSHRTIYRAYRQGIGAPL